MTETIEFFDYSNIRESYETETFSSLLFLLLLLLFIIYSCYLFNLK